PARLAEEIHIADEEIAAAFENRRHEFSTPERRHLEQIVLPSAEAAAAAAERLEQGAGFASVAQGETGSAPSELGTVRRDDLAGTFAPLAEAAFTAPEDGVSAPTETTLGVHLVHVLEIEPATEATLEEYRDQVARDLALEQAADSIISIANQFEDELAG